MCLPPSHARAYLCWLVHICVCLMIASHLLNLISVASLFCSHHCSSIDLTPHSLLSAFAAYPLPVRHAHQREENLQTQKEPNKHKHNPEITLILT